MRIVRGLTILLLAGFMGSSAAWGGQIVLNSSDVIGASGSYYGSWNEPQFGAQNVLSQQTGSIHEDWGDYSYWINPDNGPANAYIVIDLGAAYQVTSIVLFNTHNGWANDRGTGAFQIEAGNSVGATGAGYDITGALSTILSGSLTADSNSNYYLTPQSFTVSAPGAYRYLRFEPLGQAVSSRPCCGANVYGLNEIRIFSDVPEPATWLTAVPLLALLWKRRAR